MIKTSRFILIFGWLILLSPNRLMAEDYAWPMKIPVRLSSRFGDYRPGHWHAGIDITTKGKTGYRVYAAADGYITRARTAFWGYGKGLYLKLDDGRYVVYGHLDRFSPELEKVVREKQMNDKKYYQDIYFEPGRFRVKRGDVIAYSGQTGSGAPHLHFEIRDANNYPINLLKDIYKIPDDTAPIIDHLLIRRYKTFGLANYNDSEFLHLEGKGRDLYVADTVAVYGQVVFAISGYDPGGGYNFGLYGAKLIIDSTEVFAFKQNRLDYSAGSQIDYVRDNELAALMEKYRGDDGDFDKGVFYKLYIQPDDRQSFYGDYRYPAGIIFADSLAAGAHEATIVAYDVAGNMCRVRFYFQISTLATPEIVGVIDHADSLDLMLGAAFIDYRPEIQRRKSPLSPYEVVPSSFDIFSGIVSQRAQPQYSDYRIRIQDDRGNISPWVDYIANPDSQEVVAYADRFVIMHAQGEGVSINNLPIVPVQSIPLPDDFLEEIIAISSGPEGIQLRFGGSSFAGPYFIFNSGGTAVSADSSIALDLTADHLYGPTVLSITSPQPDNSGGYRFSILPEKVLFAASATIKVFPAKLGIDRSTYSIYYYLEAKDDWVYIGDSSASEIYGKTYGGGKFGILIDNQPPSIGSIRPRNDSSISEAAPNLSCIIDDGLSGISKETQLEMTIDGIWVPAAYDIDNKIFAYQVRNGLAPGRHALRIVALDNQGNRAEAVSRFTINGSSR